MGCNSSYLEPTSREYELQRTAKLLAYVETELYGWPSQEVSMAAQDMYCKVDFVPKLCERITCMNDVERDAVVYNAKNKASRDLADWWETHQAADKKRKAADELHRQRREIQDRALSKLTAEERESLGYK